MSQYGMTADGRPLGKERSPAAVVLLSLVTVGVYYAVWYYKINREMRDHDSRIEVKPGLATLALFVPIGSWITAFNTATRLQQLQEMEGIETTCSPGLALVLLILTGIGYPIYMASLLRRHWQLHVQGLATAGGYSPYQAVAAGGPGAYGQQPPPAQDAYQPPPAPAEQLSPDGRYRWDGISWQPVAQPAQPPQPPAAVTDQLSPDGRYRWDGQSWLPVQQAVAPPVATAEQLSPDGQYRWDGHTWQPVQQVQPAAAAQPYTPAVPDPGGQLSPDGRYRWDGHAWQPVQQ